MEVPISLTFSGIDADEGKLDLYDASISNYGLARVVSVLGHYYQTGKIISQAPRSEVKVYLYPPEEGSFKQTVAASIIGGVVATSFSTFFNRTLDSWFPNPDPQMEQVIELLKEKNQLLRQRDGLGPDPSPEEMTDDDIMSELLENNNNEFLVLRSITANSFKDVFRPIGRSAEYVGITTGSHKKPLAAINPNAVALIESERRDPNERIVVGVVNSFSRSSKTGYIFSREIGRGLPIKDIRKEKLPPQDDYSWSQYTRRPIEMVGTYVHWFDGSVKKFLVESTTMLPDE